MKSSMAWIISYVNESNSFICAFSENKEATDED